MSIKFEFCDFYSPTVEREWRELYENDSHATPLLSYDFNKSFLKYYYSNKVRKGTKPVLIKGSDEKSGKTLMFIPACRGESGYYMLWDYSAVPYCDVLLADGKWDAEKYDSELYKLASLLDNKVFNFTRMNNSSPYTEHLHCKYVPSKNNTCIRFDLLSSYNMFYKLMSKDMREYLSASADKLLSEGHTFKTAVYYDQPIGKKTQKDLFKLHHGSSLSVFGVIQNKFRDKRNAITELINEGADVLTAISYIDGAPAAFVSGVVRNGIMTVVRSGVNHLGYLYSAEYLNLCDLIKYSIERKRLTCIDFGRDNDAGKLEMGGKEHQMYSFEINF